MIWNLLIDGLFLVLTAIFYFLPEVSLADIPIIGSSITTNLPIIVHHWNGFMEIFPYAEDTWNVFLYVIIPFEILLLIAKFFLGHHVPVNHSV